MFIAWASQCDTSPVGAEWDWMAWVHVCLSGITLRPYGAWGGIIVVFYKHCPPKGGLGGGDSFFIKFKQVFWIVGHIKVFEKLQILVAERFSRVMCFLVPNVIDDWSKLGVSVRKG